MFDTMPIAPDRREQVEEFKKPFKKLNQSEFLACVRKLKDEKKGIEEDLKDINLELEAVCEAAHELFEEWDLELIKNEHGRLTIGQDLYAAVNDRPLAIEWLKQVGLQEILKEDFNWQTINSLLKQRVKEGESLPDEQAIKMYFKRKINFRMS